MTDELHQLALPGVEDPCAGDVEHNDPPQMRASELSFTFGAGSESAARKRRGRHKRALDSARKLRRSTRLAEKECPNYEDPSAKASRVQAAPC